MTATAQPNAPTPANYDHPWKDVLDGLLPWMLKLFRPKLYRRIDWSKGYASMEQELSQITPDLDVPKRGRRFVDKLFKVTLKSGEEELLYIHIKVQGDEDQLFPERMFVYNYRLYDKFGPKVTSFAILIDDHPDWNPKSYTYGCHGSQMRFNFPTVKLLNYETRLESLARSNNPFALVVMAHLKARRTKSHLDQRAHAKFTLMRLALSKGWGKTEVKNLIRVIDWVVTLPKDLDKQIRMDVKKSMEGTNMAYMTSWEQITKEEGKEEALGSLLSDVLNEKFGKLPNWVTEKIKSATTDQLYAWNKRLIFKDTLEEILA